MSTTVIQNNTVTVTQDATKTVVINSPGPKGDPGTIQDNTGGTISGVLTINGDISSSGNISASGTIVSSNLSGTNTGDQSLDHLAITGSNVTFAEITASGNISASGDGYFANVGIGTTSPIAKLHLQSSENAATSNLLYLENIGSGGSEGVSIKFNPMFDAESMIASNREGAFSNVSNLTFHTYSSSMAEAMRIDSTGKVGIGTTSPEEALHLQKTGADTRIQII